MFSFFQRKTIVSDISWLGVDIHSHLLPGIDDGSASMENSLAYIHKLQELGFEKLICTPHIFTDLYPNTPETILPVLDELKVKVKSEGLNVHLDAAAEYMADDSFKVETGLLTLPGQHILIEMSYLAETPNIDQIIFELHVQGYKVVLAHPERYLFYHKNFERYQRMKELGCLLQLNLLSVTGYYGKSVKSAAEAILKAGLYDCAGTDLHHERHLAVLEKNVQNGKMYELIGNYEFKNKELFI
jgi:protein-tyrosine phosphatase